MKRLLHWKRDRFDSILSSSAKLWTARTLLILILASAGIEAWVARTAMVGRIDWSQLKVRRFVSLEDSVETLRRQAPPGRLDSARLAAYRGVFTDWDDLASWLEDLRSSALGRGWAMEWQLVASEAPQPFPDIQRQSVVLHLNLPEANFSAAQAFMRNSTQTDARRASLVRLDGSGDRQGIADLRWTLQVWVRNRRG